MKKIQIVKQLMQLLLERKKYWLIPVVFVFIFVGLLLLAAKGSVVAPFIYTLF